MEKEDSQDGSDLKVVPEYHVQHLSISANRVFQLSFIIVIFLTVANFIAVAAVHMIDWAALTSESDIVQLFGFDEERNLPTWFQGITLAICGVLLLLIGTGHRQQGRTRESRYWILLAAIFFGLSFDEMVSIHEQWIVPVRSILGITGGFFYFAWVIPAALLLVVLTIALIPFLRSLPTSTRLQFLAAGMIFVAGTIGMELISGAYVSDGERGGTIQYKTLTTAEELLEMTGIAVFLRALLIYMSQGDSTIRFSGGPIGHG